MKFLLTWFMWLALLVIAVGTLALLVSVAPILTTIMVFLIGSFAIAYSILGGIR